MNLKKSSLFLVVLIVAMVLCMTGCKPQFVDINDYLVYEADPPRPVKRLTTVVTAEDIGQLEEYPALEKLDLTGSTCYPELLAYVQAHPDVKVTYTVNVLGTEYDLNTVSMDLSEMTAQQIDEVAQLMPHFPELRYVELVKEDGTCNLSMDEFKALADAAPGVPFNYSFPLFGQTISTGGSYIEFTDQMIGDEGLDQIRAAMDLMPNLYSVRLDNCGTTSEAMDKLRSDYPNIKIDWRVWFGKYNCMTDEEVLRITNGLLDEHIGEMKYLTEARYVDIGHNEFLTDISFFKYMPKVELIIASGSAISDLSPLSECKNLEFLELVFCGNLKDLTPLAGCTGLKYLNISMTKVAQLDALKDLPLERMVALQMNRLGQSERDEFSAAHDDCLEVWYGSQPYGYGWRYSDQGYTFYKYYANMRIIFDYDDKYFYTGRYYNKTRL